jgi:predicted nuclease with TOPRIM domain
LRRYVEYDVYWKAQARIKELEAENKQFHEDGLKVYGSKIQLLNKRIKELEQERDRYREALEGIAKTDVSTTAPDFLWLQQWRHNTKDAAREALNDRA